MKNVTKHPFTLLEIVVSMALLAVISSLFVYNGWQMIKEQRYISSIKRVQNEIYGAKLNALSYGRDLTLTFTVSGNKTTLFIDCLNPPKALVSRVNRKIDLPNLALTQKIIFYSNGHTSSKEPIVLIPAQGNSKQRVINLSQIDRMKVK